MVLKNNYFLFAVTLESYAERLITSGAIQNGVPTIEFRLLVVFVN